MKLMRRPKFSLGAFLVVVTLVAVVVGVFGNRAYRDYLETQADTAIEASGAQLIRSKSKKIVRVMFSGAQFDDKRFKELAPHLRHLPTLEELDLVSTSTTDAGIDYLLRLKQVEEIYLFETGMTSEGIARLDKLMPGTMVKTEMPERISSGMAMMNVYTHAIVGLDWAPDGVLLATGSGDGLIRIWDFQSPDPVDQWKAHENWAFAVTYSSDGSVMATGGGDNMIRVWESATGDLKYELAGHTDDVHSVCFTPDGKGLVSSGDDKTIRFWDLATKKLTRTLVGHSAQIPSIAISPQGHLLASASRDDTIRVWDTRSGETLIVLPTDSWDVNTVAFDSTGKFLASGDQGGNVVVWDLKSYEPAFSFVAHDGKVYGVEFDAVNNLLASCGDDGVRITDVFGRLDEKRDGSLAAANVTIEAESAEEVAGSDVANQNDSDGLVIESHAVASSQKYVSNLAFHPEQDLLATTNAAGEVHLIDAVTRDTVQVVRTMYGERGFDLPPE